MSPSILVVDDAADIRELLQLLLEMEGYSVRQACDGREALDRMIYELPSLILLDLEMPVMDGWQFHAAIRARHLLIPVVFMTASSRACAEAVKHGAAGFLAKPFEIADVLDTVARCVA